MHLVDFTIDIPLFISQHSSRLPFVLTLLFQGTLLHMNDLGKFEYFGFSQRR